MTSSLFVNIRAALNGVNYSPAGYFFAVDGTVYPGAPFPPTPALDDGTGQWCGFSSGIWGGLCNAQDGLFAGGTIGYPASVVPMQPSWQGIGVPALASAVEYAANTYYQQHGTYKGLALFFSGYSQGAMVVAWYYSQYILNPTGPHAYLAPYVYRVYQFGDPFRTPGIAHGNALAGLPESIKNFGVETGGIGVELLYLPPAVANLTAPDGKYIYNSCANHGDIYTCCPVGTNPNVINDAGKTAFLIFEEIQKPGIINTLKIAQALFTPVGTVEEIINGMVFAAEGQSPHTSYGPQMAACIADALAVGNSLPHQGC